MASGSLGCGGTGGGETPTDIGSRRQLFVDDFLIAENKGVRLVLHPAVRREIAISNDNPWERTGVSYMVTFKDGDRFRAWYRCDAGPWDEPRLTGTAYAESRDGIHWEKPGLGIVEFDGAKDNNLVWAGPGTNMAVFKDGNPAAPEGERYKAIVVRSSPSGGGLLGLASADGLRWRLLQEEPILTDGPFDSHNIAFWDDWKGGYVVYARGIRREGELGWGMARDFSGGVRWIRRSTSNDFRRWTPLEPIDTGDAPLEQLYTNAAVAYERSPGLYLMFPSRFANAREPTPGWEYGKGVNDIVLLTSRDGIHFQRMFLEAFVRPGPDQGNWHERALYMERGILETGPDELSLYGMENWRLGTVHIRRYSIRPDGFASAQAGYAGGELITRPLRFAGKQLRVNFSTSAVGSVEVEIQDAEGNAIAGFELDQCPAIYGDALDRAVEWRPDGDLGGLAGRPVRLRFVLKDADLYALRFGE